MVSNQIYLSASGASRNFIIHRFSYWIFNDFICLIPNGLKAIKVIESIKHNVKIYMSTLYILYEC